MPGGAPHPGRAPRGRRRRPASITWPADRAWLVAADVDDAGLTVGGSQRLVDAILAHPELDAESVTYGVLPTITSEDL